MLQQTGQELCYFTRTFYKFFIVIFVYLDDIWGLTNAFELNKIMKREIWKKRVGILKRVGHVIFCDVWGYYNLWETADKVKIDHE